jgi:hypothetical protein
MNTRYKIIEAGGFKFLKNPTEDELQHAVNFDGTNLQYVTNQTHLLCQKALEQTEKAFPFIIEQDEELCKLAVERNALLLRHVKNKTKEICELAVIKNSNALKYVDEQSYELCLLAVLKYPEAIEYVKDKTDDLIEIAVKGNYKSLAYIDKCSDELMVKLERAINYEHMRGGYVTAEFNRFLVRLDLKNIAKLHKPSIALVSHILSKDGMMLEHIKHYNLPIGEYADINYFYKMAVNQNGNALKFAKFASYEVAILAVKNLNNDFGVLYGTRFSPKLVEYAIKHGDKGVVSNWVKFKRAISKLINR